MKSEFQIEIIDKIRKIRQKSNVSQAYLAEILGLNSYGVIGNIESIKYSHKYTLKHIYIITEYFKYPIEELFLTKEELSLDKDKVINLLFKKIILYEN